MSSPAARSPLRLALGWLGWWVVLAALWLALVDTVATPELVAGAVAAAVGATAARVVDALGLIALRLRARWLLGLWRPVVRLVPDSLALTAMVARRLLGRRAAGALTELPFRRGPDEEARAVMVKIAGSLAPGAYVVRIDEDQSRMLVHTLPAAEDPGRRADPLGLA
jgi:multisubunit Na+/H+ antiporter MnhE subunit